MVPLCDHALVFRCSAKIPPPFVEILNTPLVVPFWFSDEPHLLSATREFDSEIFQIIFRVCIQYDHNMVYTSTLTKTNISIFKRKKKDEKWCHATNINDCINADFNLHPRCLYWVLLNSFPDSQDSSFFVVNTFIDFFKNNYWMHPHQIVTIWLSWSVCFFFLTCSTSKADNLFPSSLSDISQTHFCMLRKEFLSS